MNESELQDRKDLQKGALINYLGYPLKAAHPVLMVFLVRAYSAEAFGLFITAQAVLLVLTRMCVLGLDKALLWWVPQQAEGERAHATRACLTWSLGVAAGCALLCMLGAELLADWIDAPEAAASLRIMSFSLVPMVGMELLLGMTMGTRRMGTSVLVRETIQPLGMVLFGLALYPLGWGTVGLSVAMVLAYSLGCVVALWSARRIFASDKDTHEGLRVPEAIWQYAWPLWVAEMASTSLQRMDTWAIAALSDLRTVGIYGVVVQFSNTIRQVRRGYDHILLAVTARIFSDGDTSRLTTGYSYVTSMVLLTQLPILMFFILFAGDLLPLYGEGFEEGTTAVVILSAFWVFNGATALSGVVISAYGRSRITLCNALGTVALQGCLLWWFVPRYGLDGAACAVGLAYALLSVVQIIQMRMITHGFHYREDVMQASLVGLLTGGLLMLGLWLVPNSDELWVRAALFGGYALLYLPLAWPLARQQKNATQAT